MKSKAKIKVQSLEQLLDKHVGKVGSDQRDSFEQELQIDLFGEAIKRVRLKRQLTQSALGDLLGVQKAQISKLENNAKDVRIETLLKVFSALDARVHFRVELY